MKSQSTIRPPLYSVEKCGDIAEIILYENIEENEYDGETFFTYDEYRINIPYRNNLENSIEQDYNTWLQHAKNIERTDIANKIRAERNRLLAESDWTQNADSPLDSNQKSAWATYRQALRDVPEQQGFPYEVSWPTVNK